MAVVSETAIEARLRELEAKFPFWEKIKDCIDQNIDVFENYRQSGHPGGSRSKVHMLVALTLGGFMRWDIRHPEKRFGDRFILVAGHTVPVIYAMLAVYNTALRAKYERTGDAALCGARRRASASCCGGICSASAGTRACRATPRWRARRSS